MNGMQELLSPKNVQIVDAVDDWESAIRLAVRPLEEGGFVTSAYADGIIENARRFGPYFVISPDLALLHARPEQGAIKKQLALTILREGVRFKEDGEPVRVLVTLAAEDANSHVGVLMAFANQFADHANVERLAEATTAAEAYDLFVDADE